MRLIIEKNYDLMSEWAANYVAKRINEFAPRSSYRLIAVRYVPQADRTQQRRQSFIPKRRDI